MAKQSLSKLALACGVCYIYNEMKEKILNIETVHECNCCLGCKTLHPLVSVIDLSQANRKQFTIKFDFYTIIMIEGEVEDFLYGRKYCDYSNASLVFLTPGEYIEIGAGELSGGKGWLLAFHPDLLYCTSLHGHINDYSFFYYKPDESLHLSLREKAKVMECLRNTGEELLHAIDCHSKTLISRYIELLLDYCTRFYERQFITREESNKAILCKLERILDAYIESGKLEAGELPDPGYCAGELDLSDAYFNDLIKFETGKTPLEYFQFKRFEIAKRMLLQDGSMPGYVARKLGFSNVRHFSLIFKKITGIPPREYRYSGN